MANFIVKGETKNVGENGKMGYPKPYQFDMI